MTNQPLVNLKPVMRCTASYVKELEELKEELRQSQTEAVHYQNLCLGGKDKVENHEYIQALKDMEQENTYLKEERRHLEKSLEMFKGQSKGKENEALREFKENWIDLKAQIVYSIEANDGELDMSVAEQVLREMKELEGGEG